MNHLKILEDCVPDVDQIAARETNNLERVHLIAEESAIDLINLIWTD